MAPPPASPFPPGFVRRIAFSDAENFLTGTYTSGGKRIGYIRTPQITPNSPSLSH